MPNLKRKMRNLKPKSPQKRTNPQKRRPTTQTTKIKSHHRPLTHQTPSIRRKMKKKPNWKPRTKSGKKEKLMHVQNLRQQPNSKDYNRNNKMLKPLSKKDKNVSRKRLMPKRKGKSMKLPRLLRLNVKESQRRRNPKLRPRELQMKRQLPKPNV